MDDPLGDFLAETTESPDLVDMQLAEFERDPNNAQILDNIFRLARTIKGTADSLVCRGLNPSRMRRKTSWTGSAMARR